MSPSQAGADKNKTPLALSTEWSSIDAYLYKDGATRDLRYTQAHIRQLTRFISEQSKQQWWKVHLNLSTEEQEGIEEAMSFRRTEGMRDFLAIQAVNSKFSHFLSFMLRLVSLGMLDHRRKEARALLIIIGNKDPEELDSLPPTDRIRPFPDRPRERPVLARERAEQPPHTHRRMEDGNLYSEYNESAYLSRKMKQREGAILGGFKAAKVRAVPLNSKSKTRHSRLSGVLPDASDDERPSRHTRGRQGTMQSQQDLGFRPSPGFGPPPGPPYLLSYHPRASDPMNSYKLGTRPGPPPPPPPRMSSLARSSSPENRKIEILSDAEYEHLKKIEEKKAKMEEALKKERQKGMQRSEVRSGKRKDQGGVGVSDAWVHDDDDEDDEAALADFSADTEAPDLQDENDAAWNRVQELLLKWTPPRDETGVTDDRQDGTVPSGAAEQEVLEMEAGPSKAQDWIF